MKKILLVILMSLLLFGCAGEKECIDEDEVLQEKPVLYLYPEDTSKISVNLDVDGQIFCSYPEYNNGWNVIANRNGEIKDISTGKEYSYLFWEAYAKCEYDMSKGYVVEGKDTAEFLESTLTFMGLNQKERNDFIVYWLPRMKDNKYNLITFQTEAYTSKSRLIINPSPDSILRVFMVFKPIDEMIELQKPVIKPFERKGFTVVEWGGSQI